MASSPPRSTVQCTLETNPLAPPIPRPNKLDPCASTHHLDLVGCEARHQLYQGGRSATSPFPSSQEPRRVRSACDDDRICLLLYSYGGLQALSSASAEDFIRCVQRRGHLRHGRSCSAPAADDRRLQGMCSRLMGLLLLERLTWRPLRLAHRPQFAYSATSLTPLRLTRTARSMSR